MRPRRHSSPSLFSTMAGRRWARRLGFGAGALVVGYLITLIWFPPGPILSADHAVPRVLGDKSEDARKRVERQGFKARFGREMAHPQAPRGTIVWQDPPPGVVLEKGGTVELSASSGPPGLAVPDVIGFDWTLAEKVLSAGGLKRGAVDSLPSSDTRGAVVATRPAAGVGRDPGAPVTIVVSNGPAEISIPDVIGLTRQQARERLEQAGLRVTGVSYRPRPDQPEGVVVEQRPAPGTLSPAAGAVELILSRRPGT